MLSRVGTVSEAPLSYDWFAALIALRVHNVLSRRRRDRSLLAVIGSEPGLQAGFPETYAFVCVRCGRLVEETLRHGRL